MPSTFVPPSLPAPLSLAEVEKLRATWSYRFHLWCKTGKPSTIVDAFLSVSMLMIIGIFAIHPNRNLAMVFIVAIVMALVAMMGLICLNDRLEGFMGADPLTPPQCADMKNMLSKLYDGEAFRQAVVEQGREFTVLDFNTVYNACRKVASHEEHLEDAESCRIPA